jgi:hypothetical protein
MVWDIALVHIVMGERCARLRAKNENDSGFDAKASECHGKACASK